MSEPFLGEIRMVGFSFAPIGWAFCDGSLLSITQHDDLFWLIGTTYGGDGEVTFALPDLRGRRVVHQNASSIIGEFGGEESVTLVPAEMPQHTHYGIGSTARGRESSPKRAYWATSSDHSKPYSSVPGPKLMHPHTVLESGGAQPHENMPPYLTINFIIALVGIYPSPS